MLDPFLKSADLVSRAVDPHQCFARRDIFLNADPDPDLALHNCGVNFKLCKN